MRIVIETDVDTPPYAQIRDQVAAQARDGTLPAGTRLPAVRALAGELGLAVNTVARAYREMEQSGLVETRGRHGTVITARAAGVSTEALRLAGQYATAMRAIGVPPDQALDLARAALGL
ncbi:GntR family transcriptional regulator [Catenuloplanes japonicus]|uniref:GntR family transcriptional regulator n=1 Tax=Catenuloplanes japonicus TaxID=33876 RepID=UPI0006922DF4|nr:GntR family transcriptional regulator [Catenuloplanes japonicus]